MSDMERKDSEYVKAEQELMKCLVKGERSATEEGWISADEVEAVLRVNE